MATFDDEYLGLRELALSVRPEETAGPGGPAVCGALLEMDMGTAIVTLACFDTGDASMYFSNGGGMVGGIGIPMVRHEALQMVAAFKDQIDVLTPVDEVQLPTDGHVGFVAMTADGARAYSAPTDHIRSGTTKFSTLFDAGQRVISAFRESTNRSSGDS